MNKDIKQYSTDVLIIGGGGAATAATLAAHAAGSSTMLAVKGQFGEGGFFNPPDAVHADMVQIGLGMADAELCRIFVDEAPEAIARLRTMGMEFQSRMLATMPANDNNKTNNIVAIQKAIIEGTNTQVVEQANLTDLIVENGQCHGAVGVHDNGQAFVVNAGAVVIATGGVGQLFEYSFNPPGNTGDGYAMALRAGAELFNMEFMQQGIATTWPNQAMVMLYEMKEPYRLINSQGRAFLEDYLPEGISVDEVCTQKSAHWPVSCRDHAIHLDRAIKQEGLRGKNGGRSPVFLDMSRAERAFLPELFPAFMQEKGIDISKDLLQVQNHHHTSNGGIRIGTDAQSRVTGLFAVGEASGWQGADRLGGTMLGGSQVFGWRAGTAAAEVAKNSGNGTSLSPAIDHALAPLMTSQRFSGDETVETLHKHLQQVMWETLIVEKDKTSLATAQSCIDETRERINNSLGVHKPEDISLIAELRNMLDVGEVITGAANRRTESRGSHYRSDYPERDDANWLTNIFVSRDNDTLGFEKRWVAADTGWQDAPGDVRISPWG